jgi:S-DNA-T family DNA segregation ATPase FtsK/SpoIIIE
MPHRRPRWLHSTCSAYVLPFPGNVRFRLLCQAAHCWYVNPTIKSPTVPSLEIQGPDGHRLSIAPRTAGDTMADLTKALGLAATRRLLVDGRVRPPAERLVESGLRSGSSVAVAAASGVADGVASRAAKLVNVTGSARDVFVVRITAGPDCRLVGAFETGRWTIGRSPAAHLRVDDPTVELHHVMIDADMDTVRVTQLAGQVPVRLGNVAILASTTTSLPTRIVMGNTELTFERPTGVDQLVEDCVERRDSGALADRQADPWRREVRRGPCPVPALAVSPIILPVNSARIPIPSALGLVGAAIAVMGAAALAVILGQMMFALFALIGAFASFATWCVGAGDAWRKNRRRRVEAVADRARFHQELDCQQAAARRHHLALHSDVLAALPVADALDGERSIVWARRLFTQGGDPVDLLRCVLGRGEQRWSVPCDGNADADCQAALQTAGLLSDVGVPLLIEPGRAVAVHGGSALVAALLRSIIIQLAISVGPADWQLVIVTVNTDRWKWAEWLPQMRDVVNRPMIVNACDALALHVLLGSVAVDALRPTLLIVDDPSLLAVRTGPLRRFLNTAHPAVLVAVEPEQSTPAVCDRTIILEPSGRLSIDDAAVPTAARDVLMAGVTEATAHAAARRLAGLSDPERAGDHAGRLPTSVSLADVDSLLVGAPPDRAARRLVERWRAAGSDPAPSTPLGHSVDGLVEVDLVRDGPHALIAGTTGSGKSELLRSLVVGLAARLSPDHVTFVLVDYKGGSTFDACADLPHTVGLVTDLDDGLAERALVSLDAELQRRERLLRSVGASDLSDYRLRADAPTLPRLVVVIDEFAALAKELPDFLSALVGIAQRGRSLGVHLILATQRPAGVVTDEIRANTNLRLALRLNDIADAHDVVNDACPTQFSRTVPGRSALRLGPDELIVFQAARCTGLVVAVEQGLVVRHPTSRAAAASSAAASSAATESTGESELELAVATIRDAARLARIAPPHQPWIDVLPANLLPSAVNETVGAIPHDAVGLIDVPSEQGRMPLCWERERGHLALVGAVGSGTTSTLISVIAARCRIASPAIEHWYVIDARGDSALDGVVGLGHCGAVVRVAESERLHRLLARLDVSIDQAAANGGQAATISLAIDGLTSLRLALSSIEMAPTLALLERILADGPAVGLACCWTDDGGTSSGRATAADTWVFHVDDPGVARSFSVVPVGAECPGRLRIASSGLEGQVAIGADGMAELPGRQGTDGPAPVKSLPAEVTGVDLERSTAGAVSDSTALALGLSADNLTTSTLLVPKGDHVFIGGAAATGKSTALRRLVAAWAEVHPGGQIVEVDRRTGLTVEDIACWRAPTLVTIDDAERVDDQLGVLAGLVNDPLVGVMVIAAARLDAVRSAYGHWTREVARSRCGIILTSPGEVDGDLLGVTLPRRSLIAARPGLGWVVDGRGHGLVQIARA